MNLSVFLTSSFKKNQESFMRLSVCSAVPAALLMNVRFGCMAVGCLAEVGTAGARELSWVLVISRRRAVLSHVSCLFPARFLYLSNIFQHTILSSSYYFLALVHWLIALGLPRHKSSWGDYWRIFHKKLLGLLTEYSGFSSSEAKLTAFVL